MPRSHGICFQVYSEIGEIGCAEVPLRLRALQGHSVPCNTKLMDRTLYQGKYAFHGTTFKAAQSICAGEGIKVGHISKRIETFFSAADPYNWQENEKHSEIPAYEFPCECLIKVNAECAPFTPMSSNAVLTGYHIPITFIEKA